MSPEPILGKRLWKGRSISKPRKKLKAASVCELQRFELMFDRKWCHAYTAEVTHFQSDDRPLPLLLLYQE